MARLAIHHMLVEHELDGLVALRYLVLVMRQLEAHLQWLLTQDDCILDPGKGLYSCNVVSF